MLGVSVAVPEVSVPVGAEGVEVEQLLSNKSPASISAVMCLPFDLMFLSVASRERELSFLLYRSVGYICLHYTIALLEKQP